MITLKIASFNIKNNGIKKEKIANSMALIEMIKKEKIAILGTQELTKEYELALKKELSDYKFYGNYRFGSGIFSKSKYNENNIIITNQEVIYHKTIYLPFFPTNFISFKECIQKKSFIPRIATIIYIYIENVGNIMVINTHLEPRVDSIKIKQLEKIKKIISKSKYPVILTGDFNMQPQNKCFKDFIEYLETNNLKKVDINKSTWIGKNSKEKELDHIFIPKNWNILSKGVIRDKIISDHYPIYVTVEIK